MQPVAFDVEYGAFKNYLRFQQLSWQISILSRPRYSIMRSFKRARRPDLCFEFQKIGVGYRIDLLVEDAVIVELKAVETLTPLSQAQLLSYLKLSGRKLGLLINFNVEHLKNGIKRIANGL
jgi:GxxExxY protein